MEQIYTPQTTLAATHTTAQRNGYGLAALMLSATSSSGLMLSIVAAMIMVADGASQSDVRMGLLGLFMISCLLAELIAMGLGIVGLRQKDKGKAAAIVATIISTVMFVAFSALLMIGVLVA